MTRKGLSLEQALSISKSLKYGERSPESQAQVDRAREVLGISPTKLNGQDAAWQKTVRENKDK